MKKSKKQLYQEIKHLEEKIKKEEPQKDNSKSFSQLLNDHKAAFLVFLLPSLLLGFRKGKVRGLAKVFKQLVKFGLWATANELKKKFTFKR